MEAEGQQGWAPGWYEYPHGGGQRYWDGQRWTEHFVPPAAESAGARSLGRVVLAVWAGVMLAWATIWLGSKIIDDEIYWPVKTVVERSEVDDIDAALEQLDLNDAPSVPQP